MKFILITITLLLLGNGVHANDEFIQHETTITLNNSTGDNLTLSKFELDAFSFLTRELGDRLLKTQLNKDYDVENGKSIMEIDGIQYNYHIKENMAYISQKDKIVAALNLTEILKNLNLADTDSLNPNKTPGHLVIGGGIILSQGLCALSAGGEHQYCQSTCNCGVRSVSTTCVMGFRKTTCSCYACPDVPNPSSLYPGMGGGWMTGIPFLDYGNGDIDPWVLDDE